MKKIGCFLLAMVFLALSGCSAFQKTVFPREGIAEITGTSQMTAPVRTAVLSAGQTEELLTRIEGLGLEPTGEKNDRKGWEYSFVVRYEDGREISIVLSEETAVIDEVVYRAARYRADDFSAYFD